MYALLSMANHSCAPNSNYLLINDVAFVRAGQDMQEGHASSHSFTVAHQCRAVEEQPVKYPSLSLGLSNSLLACLFTLHVNCSMRFLSGVLMCGADHAAVNALRLFQVRRSLLATMPTCNHMWEQDRKQQPTGGSSACALAAKQRLPCHPVSTKLYKQCGHSSAPAPVPLTAFWLRSGASPIASHVTAAHLLLGGVHHFRPAFYTSYDIVPINSMPAQAVAH